MARSRVARLAFNRGLISRRGLARTDIPRVGMAAETHINWIPRVLGSMSLRPGLGYLGSTRNDADAHLIEFVFSVTQKALLEITPGFMRVWISDAVISRPSVTSAITNGLFTLDLAGWTSADETGTLSSWQTGGYLGLRGDGNAFAIRRQQVTVAAGSQNVEHGLHIVINRGPVVFRCGSTAGGDDYIEETELNTGTHSLAFTPTGNFWVEFKSRLKRITLVDSCVVEAAGAMVVEVPWVAADIAHPHKLRWDQSGDVIFVATDGKKQQRIERRATRSWSVVDYDALDGPFRVLNVSTTTITASAIAGNITLTSSAPLFRAKHVGALWQHTSEGQTVSASISSDNTFTGTIRVTGVGSARSFTKSITGTWVGTVTLQRSFDDGVSWVDVQARTSNETITVDDGLDNQIVLYRIGIKAGEYTSGTAQVQLSITTGSITGVARITGYTSETSVQAEVITELGGTAATEFWSEGRWSDYRGWPTSVSFHEGRLCWSGRDGIDLSISDAFDGFDPFFEGAAGPISRSIGSGPVDVINWMLSMQRLVLGGQASEFSVRASSLDEILTPTNFNLKVASTQGSAAVAAVKVDQRAMFVQRGGIRVYELSFGVDGVDYEASDITALVPEIGEPEIIELTVQRQPDTRLHCLRSDGTVAMLVWDKVERVICWIEIETDGIVHDVAVLPGAPGQTEDLVYYVVERTINGVKKHYLEKWAFENETGNLTLNKQADSFVTYSGVTSSVITGLGHLENEDVVVWDNGKCLRTVGGDIATFRVSGGQITVTNGGAAHTASTGVVGLPYTGSWKSSKLAELMGAPGGMLTDYQAVREMSLILTDVHHKGLKFGRNLTEAEMDDLPQVDETGDVVTDKVFTDKVLERIAFPDGWTQDSRICLLAKAPRPCTVLAALAVVEHY